MESEPAEPADVPLYPLVGPLIRHRREALGLTQAELAERVGLFTTADDIAFLESDHFVMPSWVRLQQLAEALGVSIDDLLPVPIPDNSQT